MNKYRLNPRELEILAAIQQGYSDKEIAEKFRITEDTVRHHIQNSFAKLGVRTRWGLALHPEDGLWVAVRSRMGSRTRVILGWLLFGTLMLVLWEIVKRVLLR